MIDNYDCLLGSPASGQIWSSTAFLHSALNVHAVGARPSQLRSHSIMKGGERHTGRPSRRKGQEECCDRQVENGANKRQESKTVWRQGIEVDGGARVCGAKVEIQKIQR